MKLRLPDSVIAYRDHEPIVSTPPVRCWGEERLAVTLLPSAEPISHLRLRWDAPMREGVRVLGDAWERSYGDLEWRGIERDRKMPWYFFVSDGTDALPPSENRLTEAFGVETGANTMAFWQIDPMGVTLWLDVRSGSDAYRATQELLCATVLFMEYRGMRAYEATRRFCRLMAVNPIFPDHVVYGSNNWYYAYGESSHEQILEDAAYIAMLCEGNETTPYMVIDDGWQPNHLDAPWNCGNERFPDMPRLASEMRALGVRPGIWVRYLINGNEDEPRKVHDFSEECYLTEGGKVLDPSHPTVLAYVRRTTARLVDWGYSLIKHDFSTYDILGKWGFQLDGSPVTGELHFHDRTKTTAQIIKQFYAAIYEAAGDAVIVGCNVIGHLAVGTHHVNRIGDDTSGVEWERTRKMGVNTAGFRMGQAGAFYTADADCVGITEAVDFRLNREWMHLVSHTDSALFVSVRPGLLSPDQECAVREALRYASVPGRDIYPLNWMETTTPRRFFVDGAPVEYRWSLEEL